MPYVDVQVGAGDSPPTPSKNLQHPPNFKKKDTASLFKKHHKGFSHRNKKSIEVATEEL